MPKPARAEDNGIIELRGRNPAVVVRKAEILFENGHPATKSIRPLRVGNPRTESSARVKTKARESFSSYR